MSNVFVTFNIRCEKSLIELKLKEPTEISGFIETLKNELKLEETDELVILCPTFEGKMMELQTDDDIEFLKKTKLSYNAITKEVYCNVELVVIIIHKLQDDPNTQIMILSNKLDNLASKVDKVLDEFNSKVDENSNSIFSTLSSILAEHLQIDSNSRIFPRKSSSDEVLKESKPNVENVRQKKIKKDKEKLSSPIASGSNNNSSTMLENIKSDTPKSAPPPVTKDIDVLLELLVADGYTNTIQNIIVLKRFDNDYEKAKNYLKSCVA